MPNRGAEGSKKISIVMKKSKDLWLHQFREVLNSINDEQFTSYDFIGKFCKLYESEWKELLNRHAVKAKQKVNAYIARMLSLYAKDIPVRKREGLKPVKNIHASTSRVHWWEKRSK